MTFEITEIEAGVSYSFVATDNGKVVKRGRVSASSEAEALNMLQNVSKKPPAEQEKIKQRNEALILLESKLKKNSWKIDRHRTQVELGIKTSLTNEQYQQLLQDREDIFIQFENRIKTINQS